MHGFSTPGGAEGEGKVEGEGSGGGAMRLSVTVWSPMSNQNFLIKSITCSHFGSKLFRWEDASMPKAVHGEMARVFCEHVRKLRGVAGLTQRDLALALGREHGIVARIELGERRVDLVEAYELFIALGAKPEEEAAALMRKFRILARKRKQASRQSAEKTLR